MRPDPHLFLSLRDPAVRASSHLHTVEGVRFVHAAAAAGRLRGLLTSPVLLRSVPGRHLVRAQRRLGLPMVEVTPEEYRAVSTERRASGLMGVCALPDDALPDRPRGAFLVVRSIRTPGNLGTLIRSAASLGGAGLVVLGGGSDPYDPDVVRASMGAVFDLPVVRCSVRTLGRWARARGVPLLAAEPDGGRVLGRDPLPEAVAVVLGDERDGVATEDRRWCSGSLAIPMVAGPGSLNVAQAGTVVLWEACRGRALRERRVQ